MVGALKCFYCLVCLFDEMCILEVVRDGVDGKWKEKKKSRTCNRFPERNGEGLLFGSIPGPRWATRWPI